MPVAPRAQASTFALACLTCLGGVVACSYDFGVGPSTGGGGSTASQVYVVASGSGSTAGNGSTGATPGTNAASSAIATTDGVGVSTVDVVASSSAAGGFCGDGVVDATEECDPVEGSFGSACGGGCLVDCAGGRFHKPAGRCYFHGGNADSRADAQDRCSDWRGTATLATLKSGEEQDGAFAVVPGEQIAYLGLSHESGTWMWGDGTTAEPGPGVYGNWSVSCIVLDAVLGTGGPCGVMARVPLIDGKWCTAACDADLGFVCQWVPQST